MISVRGGSARSALVAAVGAGLVVGAVGGFGVAADNEDYGRILGDPVHVLSLTWIQLHMFFGALGGGLVAFFLAVLLAEFLRPREVFLGAFFSLLMAISVAIILGSGSTGPFAMFSAQFVVVVAVLLVVRSGRIS